MAKGKTKVETSDSEDDHEEYEESPAKTKKKARQDNEEEPKKKKYTKKKIDEEEEEEEDEVLVTRKSKKKKTSNEIFKELIRRQIPNTPSKWKLNINDIKRICKYINKSIFDKDDCCIWNGYITNMNNSNKGTYVNFYFRNKKVALHRLLYSNFVNPLDCSEYLKFNCENKGVCCNINHYEKYKYTKNVATHSKGTKKTKETKKDREISILGNNYPDKLIVDFD